MTDDATLAAALRAIHTQTTWTWRNDYGLVTDKKDGCLECGAGRKPREVMWPCRTVALIDALEAAEQDRLQREAVRRASEFTRRGQP